MCIRDSPNTARDSQDRLLCAAAIGITNDMLVRAKALVDAHVDALVLDSARPFKEYNESC